MRIPARLVTNLPRYYGDRGRAWLADAPRLVANRLAEWALTVDGPPMCGEVALVIPVRGPDGPAALKLQIDDPEHPGEAAALRTWNGDGAVRLLREHDGALLLERLDSGRDLRGVHDGQAARIIAGLLLRLNAHRAPAGVRSLADVTARMLADVPAAAARLTDPAAGKLLLTWADAVREVAGDCGDRLLHWDLHHQNVLAGDSGDWVAIDPKPLAGDPAFELLPVLQNQWPADGDPRRAVRRRFEVMVEVMGLDRERAVRWTLGRTLQNSLWTVEDGGHALEAEQVLVAEALG
ncbi:aminoglycoside phosphotransferase family protein [Actinoplanes couchii]|uniref:Hydroxyurea phosphotransferase n=1 Tax=Actinoplanes couchii TaxID=403638 RepID=A0ABQ3X7W8_9ACTN|nr:aminoglycoside phosphotransferase family protein [Actinoplanes couchii]MDR6320378.1 streptomycin 6-kinase [Actinoplanes couchii]GID54609.1 hydroxyurea phosphotransferase [Actinoplanes couchii]